MNERIEVLYNKTADETADGREWAIGGLHNAEHFAELVILDCINILKQQIDNIPIIDMNDWQSGRNSGIKKCIEVLEKNFK
jgi:hypothetical protein